MGATTIGWKVFFFFFFGGGGGFGCVGFNGKTSMFFTCLNRKTSISSAFLSLGFALGNLHVLYYVLGREFISPTHVIPQMLMENHG